MQGQLPSRMSVFTAAPSASDETPAKRMRLSVPLRSAPSPARAIGRVEHMKPLVPVYSSAAVDAEPFVGPSAKAYGTCGV